MSRKEKTNILVFFYDTFVSASYWFYITIFVSKKAKTAKNIFDKKALTASIPIAGISAVASPALRFLKQKSQNRYKYEIEKA